MEPLIVRVEDTASRTATEHAFARSPVRIGRSSRNDLRLEQRFVSAWHGLIDFDAVAARYTDLGSTNGTLLDGARVASRSAVPLGPSSQLAIGALRLTLPPRKGPAPDAPAPEQLPLAPGGITSMMKQLAAASADDFDRAWRRVLVPGAVIGRFELVREIGRGSCGLVFEAKDRQLGRLVAFKAVRPGRESQVSFRQELLQREAEAAAQLNHPNIVSLHDAGTCESGPYLIMELLRGETLRDRMRRDRLPLVDAVEIAISIAWALDHAHAAGVVHRDLKPANVFLCDSGQVKVLDFGIAHVFGAGDRAAVGTPAYMAPEQWRHEPQDARTDVFGAAATLAEMVTGRLPYRVTHDWSAVLEPGARPELEAPGAPRALLSLLRRGLSPEPGDRPEDGHAWLAALLEVYEQQERAQPVEDAPEAGTHRPLREREREQERPPPRQARSPVPVVLAVAALTVALLALGYLLVR